MTNGVIECPQPEGCDWITRVKMTVENSQGQVEWNMDWTGPKDSYINQVEHCYILLAHIFQWRENEMKPEIMKRLIQWGQSRGIMP